MSLPNGNGSIKNYITSKVLLIINANVSECAKLKHNSRNKFEFYLTLWVPRLASLSKVFHQCLPFVATF
jgi:hypothetical protein